MRYIFTILVTILFSGLVSAQNDLLLLRKHNRTVRQFYPGISTEFFIDNNQLISGFITKIQNDSLYLDQYRVATMYTGWSSAINDTINTYHLAFSYKEIVGFPVMQKMRETNFPTLLMVGSAGYAALNIINAGILNQSLTGSQNLSRLGIAAAVFATGYLLKGVKKYYLPIGKKYKLVYLKNSK